MYQKFSFAVLCAGLCLVVTGCGGGGSSGGNAPPVVVGGGGTPPPPPPPTGGAGTAVFAATAMGPMLARVNFDTNGTGTFGDAGDALSSTAIDGRIGRSISGLAPAIHTGTIPASASVRMEATGIDSSTALFFSQMRAPAGATVISPLTALIDAAGSEASVRSALGLDTGANALRGSIGLTTFNPALSLAGSDADARHNAMQLTRLNVQLLAMAAVLKDTNGDPVDFGVNLLDSSRYMAQQIAATGQLNLTDTASIRALLGRSRYQFGSPPDQLDAMAGLMARYNAAVPTDLANADAARGWAWGFRFDIMVDFKTLASAWPNPIASRIAMIDAAQMRQIAADFAALQAPVPAPFMAVPDYAEVLVPDDSTILTGCNSAFRRYPSCNDIVPFTFESATRTLVSASSSEPSSLVVDLSATAAPVEPDFLRLRRLGTTFRGLVQVRYTSRLASGAISDGYLFVRVKAPGT
jgi:hypothetical protein